MNATCAATGTPEGQASPTISRLSTSSDGLQATLDLGLYYSRVYGKLFIIPIISSEVYFWSKGLFAKFFFGGRGWTYTWTNICVLKALFFCSSKCNFLKFSAYNMSLLLIFLIFIFLIMYLQLSILPTFAIAILQKTIGYQIQCSVFGILPFSPTFNLLFKFNDFKYNPQGLIFGGGGGGGWAYTWKEFFVSILVGS